MGGPEQPPDLCVSLTRIRLLRLRLETYPSELESCGRSHARVPRLQPAWNSPLETYPDMRSGSRKVPCGFSPASAGVENATAGSEASRSDGGALREFPSFSWHGTHRSALLAMRLSALRAKRHRWRCSLRITLLAAGRPAPLVVPHRRSSRTAGRSAQIACLSFKKQRERLSSGLWRLSAPPPAVLSPLSL